MDALDDKQSMTSTINKFTDNFGIVNKQSHQKERNKIHTSTNSFIIEEQAGKQVSANMDVSDNMSNREKEFLRKTEIGTVHSINKNSSTPESSKNSLR